MKKTLILILMLTAFPSWSHAQAEETAPIDAFVGDWKGVGIKEDIGGPLSATQSMELRDLDVNIEKTDGLVISWVTRTHETAKKKSTSVTLFQTAPNLFVGDENGDVLNGGTVVWGRIEEQSLIVYVLEVDQNGIYDVSRYERKLSGDRMFLYYTRNHDGRTVRSVIGELARTIAAE
jgi:hypothetical protein